MFNALSNRYISRKSILIICYLSMLLVNIIALYGISHKLYLFFVVLGIFILFMASEFIDIDNKWFKYILIFFLAFSAVILIYSGIFSQIINVNYYNISIILIPFFGGFALFVVSKFVDEDVKWLKYVLFLFLIISTIILTYSGSYYTGIDQTNDNDEALEVWINHFFNGEFPYQFTTQLGNLISPFPFLPLYSIIFYLWGNVAYQNIVNIFIILYVIWNLSSSRDELNFGLFSLCMSLPLYFLLLIQSDHMTVASLAVLGIYLLYKSRFNLGSILFGCLIASKGYVWLMIPMILYYIKVKGDNIRAVKSTLIMIVTSSIFILPFLIWNPHIFLNYAPLGFENKMFANFSILPYYQYSFTIITIMISLLIFYKTKNLFISFLSTYLFFGIFSLFVSFSQYTLLSKFSFSDVLFSKVTLLIYLASILLGIMALKDEMRKSKENQATSL